MLNSIYDINDLATNPTRGVYKGPDRGHV